LQERLQAPLAHVAVALATLVEQALPHVEQFCGLLVVSTQVPAQSVGVDDGHPETHIDPEHTGVPESAAQTLPHAEQLFRSLVTSTHAPPHCV
jgi:hypothetical protein